ncbi:DUF4231 domain-containing protein [Rhodococcus coprophilus]|uniref:SMODS and SLOG-associating 2TM effector domain-containing protein n=1 Tax=Rhodococcus coprophilus TaxID=38310 RepID=A0A2X4UT14_9NOCA|nr:DUF4231 domain-containing protein [Rhodococcus coprophilus]MBM7460271.1 hypothetical protein [Rhodococcus coprophilus]SQI38838.1 Uncharacterised protein [Rhodococcus coprophilus]
MAILHDVPDNDYPYLFRAADKASLEGQRSYVQTTRTRLLLLGGAALTGVFSWTVEWGEIGPINVPALFGVLAFVLTLVLELDTWKNRPDKSWYDGRAVAESAKTLIWKFAVGGNPFPAPLEEVDAMRALLKRMKSIREKFLDLELHPVQAPEISDWMLVLRRSSFEHRRQSYLEARIDQQKKWYSDKARLNKRQAERWRLVLIILELSGVGISLAAALSLDLTQIAAAIAALVTGVLAWTQTKQYDFNYRAYSAALSDLTSAEAKLSLADTEESWAREVDDAEEAISREHVVWLATRSSL